MNLKTLTKRLAMTAIVGFAASEALAQKINLNLCAGPVQTIDESISLNPGLASDRQKHAYLIAAEIFEKAAEASYGADLDVRIGRTRGDMHNLELIHKGTSSLDGSAGCDLGFARTDVIYNFSRRMDKTSITGPNTNFVAFSDGLQGLDRQRSDSDLKSDEIFRVYPQLLCNRQAEVNTIKDLKALAGDINVEKASKLRGEINRAESDYNDAKYYVDRNRGTTFCGVSCWQTEMEQQAELIQSLRGQLATVEGSKVVINFLSSSGFDKMITYQFDDSDAEQTWAELVKLDSGYGVIQTQIMNGYPGYTPFQAMLSRLEANANACALVIDRAGVNTTLAELDKSPYYNRTFKLISINDWDFDDRKVGGEKVYQRIDLEGKSVYPWLRSERPEGAINLFGWALFTGERNKKTLAMKAKLVGSSVKKSQIDNNPRLQRAIIAGIRAIKSDVRLFDPLFAEEMNEYAQQAQLGQLDLENDFENYVELLEQEDSVLLQQP